MSDAPFEPSASARAFGMVNRDMYEGLVQAGFTERQALTIIGQVIAASWKNTLEGNDESGDES